MKKIILHSLLIFTTIISAYAQRGRVQIQDGTVVTDKGTLIRGCYDRNFYEDFTWEDLREDITKIKEYGLNCLKIYNEGPYHPAGSNVVYMDSLVNWTREDSLYLVMTPNWYKNYGTEEEPAQRSDINFIREYWRFYADRYKDETHMIFDICNEPEMHNPYNPDIVQMELDAYDTIRTYAPDAHIMFMSSVYTISIDSVFNWLNEIDKHVDWGNASVAMHGYCEGGSEEVKAFNQQMIDSGYTLIITEFLSGYNHEYAGMAQIRVFEEQQISYLNFLEADDIADYPEYYKSLIEKSEVRWEPDFGTWPMSLEETGYQDPFIFRWAVNCDESKGWRVELLNREITYVETNDYAAYYNLNFENAPVTFEAMCSSDGGGGEIEIRLDSINGPTIGICTVSNTGGWLTYETFTCDITSTVEGVHDIYLVFKSTEEEYLFNVRFWYFGKSELLAPQTPYHETAITLPGKIEAEEYDFGGSTISFLDNDTINHGNLLRDDEVDIDTTDDGSYCIAWTGESEWLEYTFNCEQETTMDLELRFACIDTNDKFRIKLNNQVLATAHLTSTGGSHNWETVTIEDITIPAGDNQVLRIELLDGYFNLDWLNFVSQISGIDEVYDTKKTLIYPNPAKDFISVKSNGKSVLEIYNLYGQLMMQKQIAENDTRIYLNGLSSGSYLIKIRTGSNNYSEILIVE